MVTSYSEPTFSLPPVIPDWVTEFDPLTKQTLEDDVDYQNVLAKELTGDSATEHKDVGCLPEAEETESLRSDAVHALNEVDRCNGASAVVQGCNGLSQTLVSSAESIDREKHNEAADSERTELNSKQQVAVACSSREYAAGDGVHVNHCGNRESYLEVWNCFSTHQLHGKVETGLLSSKPAVFLPPHREIIKSDESCASPVPSPPASASSDGPDVVFSSPPVPMKRGATQLPDSDQSVKALPCLVPSREAPPPPCYVSQVSMPADSSKRTTDEDTSVVGRSDLPGLPAAREGDLKHISSTLPGRELGRLQSSEEEQVCNVSFAPRARLRESPQLPAVTTDNFFLPSPIRQRLPPLVMPSAAQQTPTSSSPSTATSPLQKVIAVGGVNILSTRGPAATGNSTKTSTSSDTLSPVSPRTPPVPPPKLPKRPEVKTEDYLLTEAMDGDTTDDDIDIGDISRSKF